MAISHHIKKLMATSSWIRRMFEEGIELKKQIGAENVFDFSLGNPVTEPPKAFEEKLKYLANNPIKGLHRYMSNLGFSTTREKIAQYYSKEFDMNITSNEVILTVGAAGGINVFFKSILDPQNEVIAFAPYFAEYKFYADNHQSRLIVLDTDDDFNPDLISLKKKITPETAAVIINTPNNPTGKVYDDEFYKKLAEILTDGMEKYGHPIYLLTDEPYRKIIYDNIKNPVAFKHYDYSVFVTSHSKDLSLAGERIGYVILNPNMPCKTELINAMAFSNRILGFVNAPATAQYLIEDILDQSVDIEDYKYKRDLLYNSLTEFGYKVYKPQGAFYFFVKTPIDDDIDFIQHLKKFNILAVPGIGFGRQGFFRLSYAVENSMVEKSIPYFKKAIDSL